MTFDSEAFSYLGQCAKERLPFFGVLFSRRRERFGVQPSPMLMARKTIRLLTAALSLVLFAGSSRAGLGWTLAQFEEQYGQPVAQQLIAGRLGYLFTGEDYLVAAFFRETQVSRILYIRRGGTAFDWGTARTLLAANAPDAVWDDASRNDADKSYRVNGSKDGVESYYASLTDDGQMLAIWTKEDDEAGRTKLDTPSLASAVGSSEKRTGQVTAGQGPSIGSESAAKTTHPVAKASSAEPAAPAPASRTDSATVKLRSSTPRREISHAAYFDAKERSNTSSTRPVKAQSEAHTPVPTATPTPLLMNTGMGLYNSDNTQPFKNAKKAPGP